MNIDKSKELVNSLFENSKYVRLVILLTVTIIFTIIIYPSLVITEHSYEEGDVAEKDVKAPIDFFVEDINATEAKRKLVIEKVLTVYDHDATLAKKLSRNVTEAFANLREAFKAERKNQSKITAENSQTSSTAVSMDNALIHKQILQMKEGFENKIGISVNAGAYSILEEEKFSVEISNLITDILISILKNGVVTNKEILLRESDKGILLRNIETKTNKVVNNLKLFYGLDQAATMVRIIGQPLLKGVNYSLVNLIVDFVQRLIQPNITLNRSETEELKKKAAAEINPVLYKIRAGEMLLREGERVSILQLLKLKTLHTQIKKNQIFASSLGAAMLIMSLLVITYILYIDKHRHMHDQNKNLLFMASMLVTFFILARISVSISETLTLNTPFPMSASSVLFGVPIAACAMIICLFMGFEVAISFAMVIAVSTTVIFQNRFEMFIYFLLNSTMAAYWIQNCRERKVFIKAGVKLGLLNVLLATAIHVYIGDFSGLTLLYSWAFAFTGGVGAGIITAGIVPLVEIAFDYTTDIKLLELANLDRPILRRLMIEAPGTYHHSVIVGSMVEAAATEIGANPLLAKVCGYYHDIGKIKKPMYFIENQINGKNRHDKLAPSMSSLILIAHIKNGVEMARENKLGQDITNSIRQHHGTSLISFFYEKAKKQKGEDAVNVDDFRYPGPKPRTKEAALVMLADVVEAASRTLDNPTISRIQGLVQNLINKIFSDGQLEDCELTLKDLHNIAKSFNNILSGIYHHRIEYPDKLVLHNGKGANGSSDRQQAKQAQDISQKDKANGTGHIKRLGLS
ncbi:MAG: HDIG domain-containing protein [Deltaproteobacteria bacterium]|nr:HDIG domain-containing protein [Deltaproteobacteria bacterium]MBW2661941.1 HDIG domain-containing protein [Deltaproteobacteria bacterium]